MRARTQNKKNEKFKIFIIIFFARNTFVLMRKIILFLLTATSTFLLAFAAACGGQTDYSSFISEKRYAVYLYEDDDLSVKLHCSVREEPYVSDGYKGEMTEICEVFVHFTAGPSDVGILFDDGRGGEMNYMSVTDSFYLSFAGSFSGDKVNVKLSWENSEKTVEVASVMYDGVISCEEALGCAREYDGETFSALTDDKNFLGEIYVRLLSDAGKCYYYVGVCDREGNISAYLVDGEKGGVIAERKT